MSDESIQPESAIAQLAREAGFTDAALVSLPYASETLSGERFRQWVEAGCAGEMRYLERRDEQGNLLRERAQIPFPWARSAILCWASYNTPLPRSTAEHAPDAGWIARYAWSGRTNERGERVPSDYHKVLKKRLEKLESLLRATRGEKPFEARGFVDTGPVLERALAAAAGLGWIGKNLCLISPCFGSFGFLAVLLTSLDAREFASQRKSESASRQVSEKASQRTSQTGAPLRIAPDRCGSCTRCIDACPTGALTAPRAMDARRCIAYLTIEQKGVLDEELLSGVGRQIFGCDLCQDVCPWNRKAEIVRDVELEPRTELVNPSLAELGALSESEFEKKFNGSPVRRAGYFGFLRNVAVAMGNSGDGSFQAQLVRWAETEDAGLRHAAHWAQQKLGN